MAVQMLADQPIFLVWEYSKRNLYKGKFIYYSLVVSVRRQLDRYVKYRIKGPEHQIDYSG